MVFDPTDGTNDIFDTEEEARTRAVEIANWLLNQQYATPVCKCVVNDDNTETLSPHEFTVPLKVI